MHAKMLLEEIQHANVSALAIRLYLLNENECIHKLKKRTYVSGNNKRK